MVSLVFLEVSALTFTRDAGNFSPALLIIFLSASPTRKPLSIAAACCEGRVTFPLSSISPGCFDELPWLLMMPASTSHV